jgi:hypothetical protein
MTYYCTTSDVGSRLGLDSSQRSRASSRLNSAIRRATIEIDLMFRDFGRDVPSDHIAETTLNGAISAGATTITLTSASSFSTAGNGNIDGDSFKWTGKSSNDLTGVTGITFSHASGVAAQEGEFAHVLREICADLAAAIYIEDESVFQGVESEVSRGMTIRERAMKDLRRIAHLGTVD